MTSDPRRAALRAQLREGLVLAPGVYNGLFARLVEEAGFRAVYMTGFGTAARYGYPDTGLVTQTEMANNVRMIGAATSLPVIADADTGYGNVINVYRTVQAWEAAGAAALHLEDQVFPKKCGFMAGKQVIPIGEAVMKVRAALDARTDPELVIIARTDALAVNGWDDVVTRVHAFREAGADLVFVDGIRRRQDLDDYVERVVASGLPCLYNGALVGAAEAAEMGFQVQILPGLAIGAVYEATTAAMNGALAAVGAS
jgi:2,3-dimethylmalate lyase